MGEGDDADPDRPKRTGTGVGLQNVRRRLSTVYGDTASLTTSDRGESFQVELLVPVRRDARPAAAEPTMETPEVHA